MTDLIACRNCQAKVGHRRGLCGECYGRLRILVRQGKTTWMQLEAAGRCRPTVKTSWRKPGPPK
jgi:hypothetical protein